MNIYESEPHHFAVIWVHQHKATPVLKWPVSRHVNPKLKTQQLATSFVFSYSSNQKPGWRHMQTFHAANNPLQDWKLKPKRVCCNLPRKATILSSQSHQGIQDRSGMIPLKSEVHRPARVFVKKFTPSIFQDEVKPWYSMDFANPSTSTPPGSTSNNSEARCPAGRSHNPFQMATWKQSTIGMQRHKLHMVTLLVSSTFPNLWIPDLEVVTLSFI